MSSFTSLDYTPSNRFYFLGHNSDHQYEPIRANKKNEEHPKDSREKTGQNGCLFKRSMSVISAASDRTPKLLTGLGLLVGRLSHVNPN